MRSPPLSLIAALALVAAGCMADEAAQSVVGADIIAAVPDVIAGGAPCDSWAACQVLLDEGEDIDDRGAFGSVDLDDLHEPGAGAYEVWELDANGAVAIEATATQVVVTEDDL